MKDIKTKESKKDIKVLNKVSGLAKVTKNATVRTKDQVQNLYDDGQITPDEYAEDKIKYMAESAIEDTGKVAKKTVQKTYDGGKRLYKEIRRTRKETDAIKQTAKSTGKSTAKTMQKSIKTGKRTVKTAQQTAKTTVKTAEKTAKAAKKTAKASAKAARTAAQAARQAARATNKAAVFTAKAVVTAVKAAISGIKALVAAIAAGGWVAVVIIIVICLVALIAGTCVGVFMSDEEGTGGIPLSQAVSVINDEFRQSITDIQNSAVYDDCEISASDGVTSINWEEVLTVFAVKMTTGEEAQDAVCLKEEKIELLREIMWDMNTLTSSIHKEMVSITGNDEYSVEEDTEVQSTPRTVLTITVNHKSCDDMIVLYGLNEEQQEQIEFMKSPEYTALWGELLGGYTGKSSTVLTPYSGKVPKDILSWPLEQSGTLSFEYGYRCDPISGGGSYHGGIDIGMPEGTPILSSADGTVMIANSTDSWGGSYGYYIKINHSDTVETLYAHCSSITVTCGETVKRGQVIGYVGSTGNSTGNHLHYEIWKNGARVNPLYSYE